MYGGRQTTLATKKPNFVWQHNETILVVKTMHMFFKTSTSTTMFCFVALKIRIDLQQFYVNASPVFPCFKMNMSNKPNISQQLTLMARVAAGYQGINVKSTAMCN